MEYMEARMQDLYDACEAELAHRLDSLDGRFVGSLSDEELLAFERAVEAGYASRSYRGFPALLGLARVKISRP